MVKRDKQTSTPTKMKFAASCQLPLTTFRNLSSSAFLYLATGSKSKYSSYFSVKRSKNAKLKINTSADTTDNHAAKYALPKTQPYQEDDINEI